MKSVIIGTALALASTTAAFANGFGGLAYSEYAIEAETLELGLTGYYELDAVALTATVVFDADHTTPVAFNELNFGAIYDLTETIALYGEVSFDQDFDYDEALIGVTVNF